MDTPINRLALRQAQEAAARLGTFKVVGDLTTGVSFEMVGGNEHGKTFTTYNALQEALKGSQYRMREVFGAGLPQPGSGWYKYPFLNTVAEEWGKEVARERKRYGKGAIGTVARDSWKLQSQANATALSESLAGGFPVIDDDSASVLRLMHGDQEASYDEVVSFLRRRFGMKIGDGSKVDKRMKAFMSMRGIGSAEMTTSAKDARRLADAGRASEVVGRYRVGVFDQTEIEKMQALLGGHRGAKDLATKATEGQSIVRASVVRHQVARMRAEGNALLGANAQQDLSGMRIRKRGHDMLKEADELERGMNEGRIFGNMRMMGLDVVNMENGKANNLQGQIKGDALVLEDDVFDRYTGGNKLDVITARWNIKRDLQMTKARLFTIEKHVAHDVFLDVQSVSSFPEFFPVERMKQKMLDDFSAVLSKDAPFEDMQRGLLAMVKEIDDAVGEFGPGNRLFEGLSPGQRVQAEADLKKAAEYGEDIKETLRLRLSPHERPALMSSFMTSYRRYLLAEKKGEFFPRMRVPDAKAAGIITHRAESTVKEGFVGYSRRAGAWVMHGKTFAELYKPFGGADLDDTLVNLLRWDEESKSVKAILYRQPNALTEFAILNVDPMDAWVQEVMEGKGTAQAKIFRESKNAVRRAQADIRAGESEVLRLQRDLQDPMAVGRNVQTDLMARVRDQQGQIAAAREAEARASAQMQADLETHLERLDMKALRKSHTIKKKGNYWIGHDERVQFYKAEPVGAKETRLESIKRRLGQWGSSGRDLGQYSNYKMVRDAQINALGGALSKKDLAAVKAAAHGKGVEYFEKLWTLETESSIDASIQRTGIKVKVQAGMPDIGVPWKDTPDGPEDLAYRRITLQEFKDQGLREMLTNMALKRKAGLATPGIDPYMLSERLAKSGSMETARGIFTELQDKLGITGNLDQFLDMAPDDTLAVMSRMEQAFIDNMVAMYGEGIIDPETGKLLIDPVTKKVVDTPLGAQAKQYLEDLVQPESLRKFGQGYKPAATDLLNEFTDAVSRHTYKPENVTRSLVGSLDDVAKVDWGAAEADVLDRLRPYMDIDAISGEQVVGKNIDQRMAALMVEAHRSGRYGLLSLSGGDVSVSRLARRAELAARLDAGVMEDGSAIPDETRALWREELDRKITLADWDRAMAEKRGALGLGRNAAEQARQAAAAADATMKPIKATPFERIKMSALKGLDSASGRWVGAGVGLLAAMGVLHTVRRDRTPEEMSGPPNLPGGNPYMGPMGGGYSFGSSMEGGQGGGVTYDVRARGGDPQALARQASFIVGPDSVGGSYSQSRSLESPDKQRDRLMASFN